MNVRDAMLVFLGGGIGSLLRYALAAAWPKTSTAGFPAAILVVNVIGCAVLGALVGHVAKTAQSAPATMAFVGIGLCGGFTTFSTFAVDALELIRAGRAGSAFAYVVASVALGLGAAAAGYVGARG